MPSRQLQAHRRTLIPLGAVLPPLTRIHRIPRLVARINRIQHRIDHQPARKRHSRLVEKIPDRRVIPVLRLAEDGGRAHVRRAEDEVHAAGLHESVVFVSILIPRGVEGPVLAYRERLAAAVAERPLG